MKKKKQVGSVKKKIWIALFCAMLTSMFCIVSVNATAYIYEVEPNDSPSTATPISFEELIIGTTRNGLGDYYDYFSFESVKGHYYRFYLYDAVDFLSGTTLIDLINPAGKGSIINYKINYDESIESYYLDFFTNYSGKYYFKFYNSSKVTYGFMLHEHDIMINPSKDATCTETGRTEGSYCKLCGAVIEKQEVIPALGHSWNEGEVTKKATCTEPGEKKYTCTACGKSWTEEIKAEGHKEVVDKEVAPSCTEFGRTEGSHCSVCGEIIKEQEEIPATGHSFVSVIDKVATCSKRGSKHEECKVCHKKKNVVAIPTTGKHTYGAWKTVKTATVSATGKKESTCKTCGQKKSQTIAKLKPTIKLSVTKKTIGRNKSYTLSIANLAKGDSIKFIKSSKTTVATIKKVKINQYKITGKKKGISTITVILKSGKKATRTVMVK